LIRDAAGDDEEIALAGAEAHGFGAEAGQVVAAGGGGHQFDAAAGGGEGERPEGTASGPVDHALEVGGQDVVGEGVVCRA